ncbi:uncharacterized protein [Linepithema humile]
MWCTQRMRTVIYAYAITFSTIRTATLGQDRRQPKLFRIIFSRFKGRVLYFNKYCSRYRNYIFASECYEDHRWTTESRRRSGGGGEGIRFRHSTFKVFRIAPKPTGIDHQSSIKLLKELGSGKGTVKAHARASIHTR